MIPFFRKIRRNLADKNQFFKYSRYAVGEIVLVVIGILIALSINNWNEERLVNNQEHKLLLELKYDLIGTFDELNEDIYTLNLLKQTSDSIIAFLDTIESSNYDESLFEAKIGWALFNVKLYPRTIAYENLKSLGIELVRNDSIRYHLTDIFDRRLTRIDHWEGSAIEKENIMYNMLTPFFRTKATSIPYDSYQLVPDFFTEKSKKIFVNRMALMQNDRNLLLFLYKELSDQISMILKLLDKEYFQKN